MSLIVAIRYQFIDYFNTQLHDREKFSKSVLKGILNKNNLIIMLCMYTKTRLIRTKKVACIFFIYSIHEFFSSINIWFSYFRDVYTKVIYNSSDCPDASNLHKNPNLTGSLNNELAHSGSLGGHSVYTGKTSGLGKSYQVPLIGYVDNTVRTRIKEAIKKTWSNAGICTKTRYFYLQ